eukprot:TRINITY_DN709_c0_g1_i1.p1 TRINITY_DN709_c0_g1~~TRINITY_DN709_c0_g1_i1.p1  ORF type:complete len:211 (-),score=61.21 TRINITY_DN709_c0_g1_i1:96-671(-)
MSAVDPQSSLPPSPPPYVESYTQPAFSQDGAPNSPSQSSPGTVPPGFTPTDVFPPPGYSLPAYPPQYFPTPEYPQDNCSLEAGYEQPSCVPPSTEPYEESEQIPVLIVLDDRDERKEKEKLILAVMTFLAGFLFPIFWCFGFAFLSSKGYARGFGFASVICLCMNILLFIVLLSTSRTEGGCSDDSETECD